MFPTQRRYWGNTLSRTWCLSAPVYWWEQQCAVEESLPTRRSQITRNGYNVFSKDSVGGSGRTQKALLNPQHEHGPERSAFKDENSAEQNDAYGGNCGEH